MKYVSFVALTSAILLLLQAGCRLWDRTPSVESTPTAAAVAIIPPSQPTTLPTPLGTTVGATTVHEAYPEPIFVTSTPAFPLPSSELASGYPPPAAVPTYTPRSSGQRQGGTVGTDDSRSTSSLLPTVFLPWIALILPEFRAPEQLLINGAFESSSQWDCINGCRITPVMDQGRSALRISQRTASYANVAQNVTTAIQQNGRYLSSVWVRSPNSEPLLAWIVLEVTTTSGIQYIGTPARVIVGDEWQQLVGNHSLIWDGELINVTWRIETEPAMAEVLIDDASLTELERISSPPQVDAVTVFPNQRRQTITAVNGGNFAHRSAGVSTPIDPIARFNIDNLGVRYARVMVDLEQAQLSRGGPIQDTGTLRQTHQMMQQFTAGAIRPGGIAFDVTIYNVPPWLLLPNNIDRRIVDPAKYTDLADLLVAWADYAQQNYGTNFMYLSFNEPDGQAGTTWSPQGMADFISIAGSRFADAGLDVNFILGDCVAVENCVHFSRPIWESRQTRPYLGLVAAHSWDNPQPANIVYEEFGAFAVETNLPLVIHEVGWDPHMWQTGTPSMDSWAHALQTAIIYSKLLKFTGASQFHFWQMLGSDYPTNDGVSGFPVFHILQQLGDAIEPGAQIVATSANGRELYSVAAFSDGRLVVQLINASSQDRVITVRGLNDGRYVHERASDGELSVNVGKVLVSEGEVLVALKGSSVNWFLEE